METPTNSILNREAGDSSLISQVVYENESLKIELEALREKLEGTGLLKLDSLRCENESLKAEMEKLRIQLAEKTNQLDLHLASSDRFSNIDESLHELLTQVQTQRAELAEMKDSTHQKEERIEHLTALLKQKEEALKEVTERASVASEVSRKNSAQAAEMESLQSQLTQVNADMDMLRRKSTQDVTELHNQLREAQEKLLAMKEEAAAKSSVRERQASSQEQEIKRCRETEASTQQQMINLQAEMERIRAECIQLRETNTDLLRRQQASTMMESQCVDLSAPEVQEHVERMVRQATEGMERRLHEQVEQNTSLISRLALMQQESKATTNPKGTSKQDIHLMKERMSMHNHRNDARTTMQRRMAELLSNNELNKKDIERLLQEMLDYQEETDQENRTLLVIKDIESEEKERVLQQELKRMKNENASLLRQLQELSVEGFQRGRNNMLNMNGGCGTSEPATAEAGSSTAPGALTGGVKLSVLPQNERSNSHVLGSSPSSSTGFNAVNQTFRASPAIHPTASYPPVSSQQTPAYQRPPPASSHQKLPQRSDLQHPPRTHTGDLWSNAPAGRNAAQAPNQQRATTMTSVHEDPHAHTSHSPQGKPDAQAAFRPCLSGKEPDRNRNIMVQCPACTFEQKYANRRCEICEATLQLH
ncbi:hypothetical protein, conserved [Leishmania tarentolae]|uniref:Uncharacterized protein n=1 Tax=Leishmania tarentolae TaxID=5689 RepID=A0A640KSG6_LEITA|nr:hypothetical protein, conserved [Leishmania tarentolae]